MALLQEIARRLENMRTNPPPQFSWPAGCYGSAASILVFVGPSPGGTAIEPVETERNPRGGLALWNQPFTEPYDDSPDRWGGKYTYSIPCLVETILGVTLNDGGDRLYGFANFDWVHCPKETNVPEWRMQDGGNDVVRVLEESRARIIVPLTKGASGRLLRVLAEHHYLTISVPCNAMIPMSPDRFHRQMDVATVGGTGPLSGAVVIRCPQHPNRVLNRMKRRVFACLRESRRHGCTMQCSLQPCRNYTTERRNRTVCEPYPAVVQ